MNNAAYFLRTAVQNCMPIIKNTVLFRSFMGQYNDNPRYISEALHKAFPDVKIVWTTGVGAEHTFPDYVKRVTLNSREYVKYASRAQVVVDNYVGCRTSFLKGKSLLKRIVFALAARRRKKQLCLSTWHGTPLKRIALDEPGYKDASFKRVYTNSDALIIGSEYAARAYKTAFGWNRAIILTGSPRNDLLFCADKSALKQRLGLPLDKKIVLFAPTFRNSVEMSGVTQVKQLDIGGLCDTLGKRFGGEWAFVFRAHNLVMREIAKQSFSSQIINGNAHEDMAEYLACADVLITDYSGSLFDYPLTGKPCFLYMPDKEEYGSTERGFYMNISELPFSMGQTWDEVLAHIRDFNEKEYGKRIAAFFEDIGNCEDGTASVQAAEIIGRFLSTGKKPK